MHGRDGGMAFLEVITRTFNQRPRMLARNVASLHGLTDADWMQTILVDEQGRGVAWAQENMANYSTQLQGRYIWILDDDDMCIRRTLLSELKTIAEDHDPDVIMVRMDHKERGILPDRAHWEAPPVHGFIGCSAYIVKRDVWQGHAGAFIPGTYYSDFTFIQSIFESGQRIYWHDVIASQVQAIGLGRAE